MNSKDIVVITGPTAVGKTEIALKIAEDFGMEIVSCDSMQVYKYMDIGSAKPSLDELSRIPHHMIDVVNPLDYMGNTSPRDSFGVVKFSEMARECIDDILNRSKIPLITGGTGLYLDSIIYDLDFASSPSEGREDLYKLNEEEGVYALYEILMGLDPEAAERIHPNNVKRVIRAIEAAKLGKSVQEFKRSFDLREEYSPILIGLTRDREELYDRINQRVDMMMDAGLLDEVKSLYEKGMRGHDYPMKGIGYKELIDYLEGEISLDDAITSIKTNSRHYAKRQFTWFKRYDEMEWFDLTGVQEYESVIQEIEEWLRKRMSKG